MTSNNLKIVPDENLIKELKNAYRKYKTHIYYNSHSAIQRQALAEFESKHLDKLNEKDNIFNKLAEDLINNKISKYYKKINVIALPKKMKDKTSKIISNYHEISTEINQIHYFIDLPVEAHILGVLWILRCGYILDDKAYDTCYGNRLNKSLLKNLKNEKSYDNFNPFLFEPYYKKYESWRDGALDDIKKIVAGGKDAIMLSLDFKNYYYSSLIDFDALKKDIELGRERIHPKNNKTPLINDYLNNFVECVFKKYQKEFKKSPNKTDKFPFIPLEFLPSLIIANWNLQGFDQSIIEDIQPSYYGRYVDDIIIVFKTQPKSKSHGDHFFKNHTSTSIVEKYFTKDVDNPLNKIFEIMKKEKKECEKEAEYIIKTHNIQNRNQENVEFHYENLEIQQNKVKLYTFNHENSTTMIDNFKKKIQENSSEFKLMNDTDKLFSSFEDQLFRIDYEESINKLNNINSVKINKFEISKFMSGILDSLSYSGKLNKRAINDLIEVFGNNIFEFFILWEKVFSILYINKNYDELEELVKTIYEQIDELTIAKDNKQDYHLKENIKEDVDNVKESLRKFLKSTIIRVLSLKSDKFSRKLMKSMNKIFNCELNELYEISSKFILTSLVNNRLMKYPIQDTYKIYNMIKNNIGNEKNINYDLINDNTSNKEFFNGFCYPRYVKFHEIVLNDIYNQIFKSTTHENLDDYLADLIRKHEIINFGENPTSYVTSSIKDFIKADCKLNCIKSHQCPININNTDNYDTHYESMKIGTKDKKELNIGLVNTQLSENDFKLRLKGTPNLSLKRFNRINRLINDAIKNKVDLLIMPEMYIPPEWINAIAKTCRTNQIGMIFGLEPIVKNSEVHNYMMTILPFEYGKSINENSYFEAMVSCRLKNDYAPREMQLIESNHLNLPEPTRNYHLYRWNGIHIIPYICYEISDIVYRSKFKSCCDIVTVSEFNKDSNYFSAIADSLSRDSYCYCIKSNTSQYGGNCIVQPAKNEEKRIVDLKGGDNDYLVIQKINVDRLRQNAIKSDLIPSEKDEILKPNPPGLNIDIIKERMGLANKYSKNDDVTYEDFESNKNKLIECILNTFSEVSTLTLSFWGLSLNPNITTQLDIEIIYSLLEMGVKLNIYTCDEEESFEKIEHENLNLDFEYKYDVLNESDALIILDKKTEFENYDVNEFEKRMKQKIIFDCGNVIFDDVAKYGFNLHRI